MELLKYAGVAPGAPSEDRCVPDPCSAEIHGASGKPSKNKFVAGQGCVCQVPFKMIRTDTSNPPEVGVIGETCFDAVPESDIQAIARVLF